MSRSVGGVRCVAGVGALLLLVWACAGASASGNPPAPALRETMRQVFDALAVLLPGALSDDFGERAANREAFGSAIDVLSRASDQLEDHARSDDAGFQFLSRSLAEDALRIRRRFAAERYADAAYLTFRLTETCVACHTRLPSTEEPGFASVLLDRIDRESLEPRQLARLEAATRQFDLALGTYESMMRDPKHWPAELEVSGALADYLIVAIRVKRDPPRARAALQALASRHDLSANLSRMLPAWTRALDELAPALRAEPSLARTREIVGTGQSLRRYPADRIDLVHQVVASSLLYRYIQLSDIAPDERAEAFYLLGVTDAFVRRSFERSEASFFLERAIRLRPGTPLAREAFARLESETLLGYSGSSGLNLPPDVERRLGELRAIAAAR